MQYGDHNLPIKKTYKSVVERGTFECYQCDPHLLGKNCVTVKWIHPHITNEFGRDAKLYTCSRDRRLRRRRQYVCVILPNQCDSAIRGKVAHIPAAACCIIRSGSPDRNPNIRRRRCSLSGWVKCVVHSRLHSSCARRNKCSIVARPLHQSHKSRIDFLHSSVRVGIQR